MINRTLQTDETAFMQRLRREQQELVTNHPLIYKFNTLGSGIRILKDCTLAFRNPLYLNDPFDCSLDLFDFTKIPASYRQKLLEKYYGHLDRASKRKMLAHFNSKSDAFMADYLKQGMKDDVAQRGITCFSGNYNHILMWSHYAESHTGICIGFDLPLLYQSIAGSSHPERLLIKVEYTGEFTPMDYFMHPAESVINWLRTKSAHWSYENEMRFVLYNLHFNDVGLHIKPIDKRCIKEVYLGLKTSEEDEAQIRTILIDLPEVKLFRMTKVKDKFELQVSS